MTAVAHKALLRRYIDTVWHQGNLAALDGFLAAEYRCHVSPTATPLDREGQKERLTGFRAAFPDIELTVEDILAEGDRVAFRSTLRGTHLGRFQGIEPTHRRVTVALLDLIRVADGRIVEQWGGPDLLDLLRQLGAVVTADPESPPR